MIPSIIQFQTHGIYNKLDTPEQNYKKFITGSINSQGQSLEKKSLKAEQKL